MKYFFSSRARKKEKTKSNNSCSFSSFQLIARAVDREFRHTRDNVLYAQTALKERGKEKGNLHQPANRALNLTLLSLASPPRRR
jgi:hypothetical protein